MKLLLFFYCMSFRRASSQVEVLWEDHRNDLFINGFGAYSPLVSIDPEHVILHILHVILHELYLTSPRSDLCRIGSIGVLMSAGGSKLKWCEYLFVFRHAIPFPISPFLIPFLAFVGDLMLIKRCSAFFVLVGQIWILWVD